MTTLGAGLGPVGVCSCRGRIYEVRVEENIYRVKFSSGFRNWVMGGITEQLSTSQMKTNFYHL